MNFKNVMITGKLIEKKKFEKKDNTGFVHVLVYFDGSVYNKSIMVSEKTWDSVDVNQDINILSNISNYVKDGQEKTYINEVE